MKKELITFFQAGIIIFSIGVFFFIIRFPLTEGRAVNLDLFSIYSDPLIIYGYLASIPFFVMLYQMFKLLGYIGQDKVFSLNFLRTLGIIKYCAIILSVAIVMVAFYILTSHNKDDDPAGFIAMCIITTFISIMIVTFATVFERRLENIKKN